MKKTSGFRMVKVFKWFIHRRARQRVTYRRLAPSCATRAISKLYHWCRSLKHGAKGLCFGKHNSGYIRVGREAVDPKNPVSVPKGHLAVYVGDEEDDTYRVLVPVMYFNHPLFGELLREAEKIYGFNHPGGIQIPCRKSELENVQMKIAAAGGGDDGGNSHRRWSWRHK
ncbi:SAUR-like auxin-responsive protein family [Abeliophyllum distichum]|uniref:SAUR-like auxin-responsive protein family n=1 Tax=Abeliophyllum distichum TaxID=126358 RepID=A0ABD1RSS7_9LAMI